MYVAPGGKNIILFQPCVPGKRAGVGKRHFQSSGCQFRGAETVEDSHGLLSMNILISFMEDRRGVLKKGLHFVLELPLSERLCIIR